MNTNRNNSSWKGRVFCWALVIVAAATIATGFAFEIEGLAPGDKLVFPTAFAVGITLLGLLFFPLVRLGKKKTAVVHGGLALLASVSLCVLVGTVAVGDSDFSEISFYSFLIGAISSSMLLLSSLIAVPVTIIPLVRAKRSSGRVAEAPVLSVKSRVESIKDLFEGFNKAVERERHSLEELLGSVQQRFEENVAEQTRLEAELQQTKQELEQHELTLQLTEEQRDAFLSVIAKGRRSEYWVGLVLGIVSSTIVASVSWLISNYVEASP